METRNKLILTIASLMLVFGLYFALTPNEAKANDDICYFFHQNLQDCDVPKVNCFCEIIIKPNE